MRFTSSIAAALIVGAASMPCFADIVFTGAALPAETFDSLGSVTVANVFSATVGSQALVPGTTGFDGTKIAGTGTAATGLVADTGGANSGAIYSYGAAAATDRALGMLASGTNAMAFGFSLLNSSATRTITEISISFTQENWRSSTSSTSTPNTLIAGWGTDATAGITTANYLSLAGLSTVAALDMVGPTPVATNGALDGNIAANQVAKSFTFTGLSIAPAGRLFVRWQDFNDQGNDAGIAIDNMNLSITSIPEPTAFLFGGLVCGVIGLGVGARRLLAKRPTTDG